MPGKSQKGKKLPHEHKNKYEKFSQVEVTKAALARLDRERENRTGVQTPFGVSKTIMAPPSYFRFLYQPLSIDNPLYHQHRKELDSVFDGYELRV
jgi:hypothetical protein